VVALDRWSYKMNRKILFKFVLVFIISFLFIESKSCYSQLRRSGEIFPWAYGIGDNDEWYVTCETEEGTVWWWNDYKLTTEHGSDRTSNKKGNGMLNPGFHACVDWQPTDEPVVAFGNYKFIFHFSSPIYSKVLFLDIRDADYSFGYSVPDLDIRWNDSTNYFEYKNSFANYKWKKLCNDWGSAKIWVLFGISDGDKNKECFQPTPPQNFRCKNS